MKKIYKLKERVLISLSIIFFTAFIMMYMYSAQSDSDMATLKKENHQLVLERDSLQMEIDIITSNGASETTGNSYYKWKDLDEKADILVEDSSGQLKKSWAMYLVNESYNYDIDYQIPYELLKVETGGKFDPLLIGPETEYGHAYGLGQFMKNTAPWIAEMADMPYDDDLLFDPFYSIHLTFGYLEFLYSQYDDWDKTLTAYHRGIAGLENYIEENGHAESSYATEILKDITEY